MSTPLRTELAALLRLTGPLLLTGLGGMLLGVVDTAIVGRLGEVQLGAVGLGNNVYFTVSVLGFGWMLALDPMIAQAVGAREPERARDALWQGLWVACVGAIPLTVVVVVLAVNLRHLGIPAETAAEVEPYLLARMTGLLPFLVVAGSRAFLQAHEITRPLVIGVVLANVLNVPLSLLLVFGWPAMGVSGLGAVGAGWASVIATLVQMFVLAFAVRSEWGEWPAWRRPDRARMMDVARLGTPIGLSLMAEVGSFAVVGILIANLGTRALGAHQVALMLISVAFHVPLALGAATSVRVGRAVGRGDVADTRRAGLVGIACGGTALLASATLYLTVPEVLARIFTDELAVVEATVPLLAVAAAFQIFDGVQAVAAGALRGAGDTRWPLISNLLGHYAIGVPLGAGLAFGLGWGAVGLWWGLSAGLTVVALALTLRFVRLSHRAIARV